ncbi:MAG: chromosome segregation ATPase [Natronomonas sp.]|jgi:chromosome segregation ATPase|uniref:hypothetical protein n=1 Tax=Natronomonas sp. TaxID=2184060 RepID=UPI0039895ABD
MDSESAEGAELSVTVPPPLDEWLDERAETLGADRQELIVQLLSAYRAAADLDDTVAMFGGEDIEQRIDESLEERLESLDTGDTEAEIKDLETKVDDSVDDLRNRILQLRDGMKNRAKKDHSHREFEQIGERIDGLSESLDAVGSDIADLSDDIEATDDRLDDVESKLTQLAQAVVALRRQAGASNSLDAEHLDHIRRAANERGVSKGECVECGHNVQLGLLTEPACPACGTAFRDIEFPSSVLGSFDPRKPKLTDTERPDSGPTDE